MRYHPAHGLRYGAVLLGGVEGYLMHLVRCHDPLCYPQARAALHATPKARVHPAVAWREASSPKEVALPPRPWDD